MHRLGAGLLLALALAAPASAAPTQINVRTEGRDGDAVRGRDRHRRPRDPRGVRLAAAALRRHQQRRPREPGADADGRHRGRDGRDRRDLRRPLVPGLRRLLRHALRPRRRDARRSSGACSSTASSRPPAAASTGSTPATSRCGSTTPSTAGRCCGSTARPAWASRPRAPRARRREPVVSTFTVAPGQPLVVRAVATAGEVGLPGAATPAVGAGIAPVATDGRGVQTTGVPAATDRRGRARDAELVGSGLEADQGGGRRARALEPARRLRHALRGLAARRRGGAAAAFDRARAARRPAGQRVARGRPRRARRSCAPATSGSRDRGSRPTATRRAWSACAGRSRPGACGAGRSSRGCAGGALGPAGARDDRAVGAARPPDRPRVRAADADRRGGRRDRGGADRLGARAARRAAAGLRGPHRESVDPLAWRRSLTTVRRGGRLAARLPAGRPALVVRGRRGARIEVRAGGRRQVVRVPARRDGATRFVRARRRARAGQVRIRVLRGALGVDGAAGDPVTSRSSSPCCCSRAARRAGGARRRPARGARRRREQVGSTLADRHALDRMVGFLQDSQNDDGGYGGQPGAPSDPLFSAWVGIGARRRRRQPAGPADAARPRPRGVRRARRPGHAIVGRSLGDDRVRAHRHARQRRRDGRRAASAGATTWPAARASGARRLVPAHAHRSRARGQRHDLRDRVPRRRRRPGARAGDRARRRRGRGDAARRRHVAGDAARRPRGRRHDRRRDPGPVRGAPLPARRACAPALDWLRDRQQPDGGWNSSPLPGPSNTGTTPWVVQALWAAGIDPRTWRRGGRDPLDFLRSMQRRDGSVRWKAAADVNPTWMTAYAAPAYAGHALAGPGAAARAARARRAWRARPAAPPPRRAPLRPRRRRRGGRRPGRERRRRARRAAVQPPAAAESWRDAGRRPRHRGRAAVAALDTRPPRRDRHRRRQRRRFPRRRAERARPAGGRGRGRRRRGRRDRSRHPRHRGPRQHDRDRARPPVRLRRRHRDAVDQRSPALASRGAPSAGAGLRAGGRAPAGASARPHRGGPDERSRAAAPRARTRWRREAFAVAGSFEDALARIAGALRVPVVILALLALLALAYELGAFAYEWWRRRRPGAAAVGSLVAAARREPALAPALVRRAPSARRRPRDRRAGDRREVRARAGRGSSSPPSGGSTARGCSSAPARRSA